MHIHQESESQYRLYQYDDVEITALTHHVQRNDRAQIISFQKSFKVYRLNIQ